MSDLGGAPQAVPTPAPGTGVWRSLRRRPTFIVAAVIIIVMVLIATFPGWFTTYDPRDCTLSRSLLRPSATHWFGTDLQGCDYYTRVIFGARASIAVGVGVTALTTVLGVVLGAVAGYRRGIVDTLISRVADILFALPLVLAALVALSIVPRRGTLEVSLVLGVFGWPVMARLMRASTLTVATHDHVLAARAIGAGDLHILRRHILPNAVTPVLVYASIFVGVVIAAEASLTFLGIGLQQPAISWGLMISTAQRRLLQAPHLLLFPGAFLSVTIFGFILMGDALRDAFDPRSR